MSMVHKLVVEEARRRKAYEFQRRRGDIRHRLLVLSGKGIVWKSTLAVNSRYVFVGNVPGKINTVCHVCGEMPVRRSRHQLLENHVQANGLCPSYGTLVTGVGDEVERGREV